MNNSGDAAEQIVRMSLEGVEVAARITGSAAKEIALLLIAALKNNEKNLKLKGKARLTSMLKSGKPLEIFSLRERDLAKFAQGAKQYGIVYCILRNTKNSPDGLCDILVRAEDAPKISRLVERFKFATVDKAKIENEIITERTARVDTEAKAVHDAGEVAIKTERDVPDMDETERLLDDLMGIDRRSVSDDADKARPGASKPKKARSEPEIAKPTKTGKEQTESLPFSRSGLPTRLPSEPISADRRTPERGISSRASVKEELREITIARKQKEIIVPKHDERLIARKTQNAQVTAIHKQPQHSKPKHKISKGSR